MQGVAHMDYYAPSGDQINKYSTNKYCGIMGKGRYYKRSNFKKHI